MTGLNPRVAELPVFDRKFWDRTFCCTKIGTGSLGGKANGLVFIKDLLSREIDFSAIPNVDINVPTMIAQNHLATLPFEDIPDVSVRVDDVPAGEPFCREAETMRVRQNIEA